MEFRSARRAVLQLLRTVTPADLPALLEWMRTTRKRPEPDASGWGKDMGADLGDFRQGEAENPLGLAVLVTARV